MNSSILPNFIRKFIIQARKSSRLNELNPTHVGETEIFRNRFILGTLVVCLGYFFINDVRIIQSFSVYLGLAILLWITQVKNLLSTDNRLYLGLLIESSMSFYLMHIDSASFAFIYPLYIWTILGNGFRFGVKWLKIASLFMLSSFSLTIYMQPFWQQSLSLSIGLLLALIIIPTYCASLIEKLSHAKEKAETANRAKSYFLASVSHELRTPLNAIIGYGTHLSDMNLSPSQLKMINASVAAGQYLLQLIDQLLQLGKSETQSGIVEKDDFSLTELLTESRDILSVRAQEKGLELLLQSAPECHKTYFGPAKDIKNLILNISSNAIKFTDQGKIIIRSSIMDIDDQLSLIISIADTGIGIDIGSGNDIFEPFQQADESIMERFGGTGLGLAICKQITDKLQAEISVSSEIGQGSIFTLKIPIAPSALDMDSDHEETECTKIISLGIEKEHTLLQAQCSGEYFITHYDCHSLACIQDEIHRVELSEYDIVILDQIIVGDIDSKDDFWKPFQEATVACILISDEDVIDIHKINIQAAFASILPPTASFDHFRKAIQIGCSYGDNKPIIQEYDEPEQTEYSDNGNMYKILVVDDNRTNRLVLESILLSDGYQVTMVNDGDEAIEALENGEFDMMLVDVNMPRLNGIEATKIWRSMESNDVRLPIVGVTADATDETLKKCIDAGMNERMTKPVEAKKLLAKVAEYCALQPSKNQTLDEAAKDIDAPNQTAPDDCNNDAISISHTLRELNLPSLDHNRIEYLETIGDRDFIRLVIDSYVDETREIASKLVSRSHICSVEDFRYIAHAVKSSANNVGALKLSDMCKKYESLTESEYETRGKLLIAEFKSELSRVESDIMILKGHYNINSGHMKISQIAAP